MAAGSQIRRIHHHAVYGTFAVIMMGQGCQMAVGQQFSQRRRAEYTYSGAAVGTYNKHPVSVHEAILFALTICE